MSDEDRCRCGHHRAHHLNVCKAIRPVGVGSTPPGFRQRTERCPCLGFTLWQTAATMTRCERYGHHRHLDEGRAECCICELMAPCEEVRACDACGSQGFRLTYSTPHTAYFCDGCYEHNNRDAGLSTVGALLLGLVAIPLLLLAFVIVGQHALCKVDPLGHSYCSAWQQAHR